MTPDPDCLYLTATHRDAMSGLNCAVLKRSGFVVLTGAPGTGKTTLLANLVRSAKARLFSVVLNPTLDQDEFLEFVLIDLGITNVPRSKVQRIIKLQELLLELRERGGIPILIVDEAHKLSPDVLEEIRLLTNFESAEGKLLQIVLAGKSELGLLLNRGALRQLKQRVEIRLQVKPLAFSEVRNYMLHRWACAGGSTLPFSDAAIAQVATASRGVPRLINSICDNALLYARCRISWTEINHIARVLSDLDLVDTAERTAGFRHQPFSTSGPPFYMRWASRLNLGTVQLVKAGDQ